jgi:hypothetical protein
MYAQNLSKPNATDVNPPPTECPRCGNHALEAVEFALGREWEVSCFLCGALWWTRRHKQVVLFQKYRYSEDDEAE